MARASYTWRDICLSALRESDPKKLVASTEQAITAIERRYADWGNTPGTPDELRAIRQVISDLERQLAEKLCAHIAVDVPKPPKGISTPQAAVPGEFEGQARRLLLSLRSTTLYAKQVAPKSK